MCKSAKYSVTPGRRLGALLVFSLVGGCVSMPAESPAPEPATTTARAAEHGNLHATLYMQTAAERTALSRLVFRAAEQVLVQALEDPTWTAALEQTGDFAALPPGVVFDVDETVLDNSAYQAGLITENLSYSTPHWDKWVAEAIAPAVPGAVAFSQAAAERGVALLYVTNRRCIMREAGGDPCPQRAETISNLVHAGFPRPEAENVYLRSAEFDFDRDKQTRRAALAGRFRILMLFGDDLGDFLPGVKAEGMSQSGLHALESGHEARWGRSWFVLPNPTYGSWLDVLGDDPASALRPWRAAP